MYEYLSHGWKGKGTANTVPYVVDTVKLHRKGELASMLSDLDIDINNS